MRDMEQNLIECSPPNPPRSRPVRPNRAFLVTLTLLLGISVFTYLNFQTVVVRGKSMETTLADGERLVVTRAFWLFGAPQRDDIVVLHETDDPQSPLLVKRLVGMGGDVIPSDLGPLGISIVVPEGEAYVVGDNLANSEDSRRFGPVPVERIVGKVLQR